MAIDIYSLFCYSLALCSAFIFASKGERYKNGQIFIIISFFIVFLFCALRFYVGNDYDGYFTGFHILRSDGYNSLGWEPSYYFLNKLFSFSPIGYIYVLTISSLISTLFIFFSFKYYKIYKWGVFCLFTMGLLMFCNNVVRQGIAISIYLYSIRYIIEGRFKPFCILVLLATTFHFSAIILLLSYLCRYIHFNKLMWFIVLSVSILLMLSGAIKSYLDSIIQNLPFYGEYYAGLDRYNIDQKFGLSVLFKIFLGYYIIIYKKRIFSDILTNLFLIGICTSCLCFGLSLFERISNYFYFTNIIVFPLVFKTTRHDVISFIVKLFLALYFSLQILFGLEKEGAVPYRTILKENLISPGYDRQTQQ